MGIRLKFNIVLLLVFSAGIAVSAWVSYGLLQANAREEVLRKAELMMEASLSMRSYTEMHVRPNLEAPPDKFLPQSVPAFAATEIMGSLRKTHAEYTYKEAALNPTNPRDKAVEWEADLINAFRSKPDLKTVSGMRMTPTGSALYLARPIQITEFSCLACHDTAADAPEAMVKIYGPNNGFGWKEGEIIGAQIVSIPVSVPVQNANRAFMTFMGSLAAIFVVTFIVLNVMLSFMIIRPISQMSAAADKISTGDFDVPEFAGQGKDEISTLGTSFNRMRRSLQKALKLLDK